MYSNHQQPLYTTRHYIHNPQSNSTNYNRSSYDQSRPPPQPYPYYSNNQQPTTVTYVNNSPNYGQQPTSYIPPNTNRYPPPNNNRYPPANTQSRSGGSTGPAGGGGIEKTNMMSNESPFHDPARSYEQHNTPRTVTSITSPPKSSGGLNKTLNLSDENPFHAVYGGYHYPSQIDPSKRITTQNVAVRSTENKSLNLSDENPFFSTYGRYHYPSQIDPQKRITEIPKAAAPLMQTNETSDDNPFNNYQPTTYRDYASGGGGGGSGYNSYSSSNTDWNRNTNPPPVSYRPVQTQQPPQNNYNQQQSQSSSFRPPNPPSPPPPARAQPQQQSSSAPLDKTSLNMSPDNPFAQTYGHYHYPSPEEIKAQKLPQNNYNQQQSSSFRPPNPPSPPPPARAQPQKVNPSAPLDKTSLNMSPDNPFAQTYGNYHYPSPEEIKAQKRANERNNRFADQQPVNNNRPGQSSNQMTEYPETEKKEIISGKGNTKYTSFEVNF